MDDIRYAPLDVLLQKAQAGDSDAQYYLAEEYDKDTHPGGRNEQKAYYWYCQAAEQGHAEAQHIAGIFCYLEENLVDYAQALHWLHLAAEQGHIAAERRILRINYFLESKAKAEAGDAEAQYRLAECYQFGRGTLKNIDFALQWYSAAAEQGHWQADDRRMEIMRDYK